MRPARSIRQLSYCGDPALAGLELIYVSALPAGERKPVAWLRQTVVQRNYRVLAAEHDGQVAGFAVLFLPADGKDAALLEYLATAETARGRGVGGMLFERAIRLAGRRVLVEIETGDANAERRRAFYRRHGCRELLGLQYLLPLPAAPAMGLMVAGAAEVRRADLRRWLAAVYVQVYGQSSDDPRVDRMADAAEDPAVLR